MRKAVRTIWPMLVAELEATVGKHERRFGDQVRFFGLSSASFRQLNGLTGTLVKYILETDSYFVNIDCLEAQVHIKAAYLIFIGFENDNNVS